MKIRSHFSSIFRFLLVAVVEIGEKSAKTSKIISSKELMRKNLGWAIEI